MKFSLTLVFAAFAATLPVHAQQTGPDPREIPVPAIHTPMRAMPGVKDLPVQAGLPDLFTFNNGKKVKTLTEWKRRRVEIRRTLGYYATGQMPPAPGNVRGEVMRTDAVLGGKATYRLVKLTFGPERKLELYVGIFTPAGKGPFPAIISQQAEPPGGPSLPRARLGPTQGKSEDALMVVGGGVEPPANSFYNRPAPTAEQIAEQRSDVLERGYALVVYNDNDCAEDTTLREADGSWTFRHTRFPAAYPQYDWGVLAVWAWGASRIADYLETDPLIDGKKLIITGASRSGKAAMIAAAFDDRLMGAPVVTGGGGIGAYRFAGDDHSETLDMMVKKYPNWFAPHLHEFWGEREKLPFDEDWFLALCAPRPFLALEGDADTISLPSAVKASVEAARAVYALYGVSPERMGVHYSHHAHAFTDEDWTALMDFADRWLRGMPAHGTFERFLTMEERTAAEAAAKQAARPPQ